MTILLLLLLQAAPVQSPPWNTPAKLQPVLRQIHPSEWKGAPARYQELWQAAVRASQDLPAHEAAVSKAPENLGESLHLLEEMRDFSETMLQISGGVRQYQNPELADLIEGLIAEGRPGREAYSQRVLELATQRDEQFAVADHEAQRCRALLSKQPKR